MYFELGFSNATSVTQKVYYYVGAALTNHTQCSAHERHADVDTRGRTFLAVAMRDTTSFTMAMVDMESDRNWMSPCSVMGARGAGGVAYRQVTGVYIYIYNFTYIYIYIYIFIHIYIYMNFN
jgi:hypothetical protein